MKGEAIFHENANHPVSNKKHIAEKTDEKESIRIKTWYVT